MKIINAEFLITNSSNYSNTFPPLPPSLNCQIENPVICNNLIETNYFDKNCFSDNDYYNNLGCNAGGYSCCRYCEFGLYTNISCIKSPSLPPHPPYSPPSPLTPPSLPQPPSPPIPQAPPYPPKPCRNRVHGYCRNLVEKNYYDEDCYSYNDPYGNLGCNAGGLMCCRFCGFGYYKNISCFESPSAPPIPPRAPLKISMENIIVPLKPDKSKVEFNIRIESTIETFNQNYFKKKLRNFIDRSISLKNIILRVRAGSLIVDVIIITNSSSAENTTDFINSVNTTVFSEALNVTVIEISDPNIVNYEETSELLVENSDPTLTNSVIFIIVILLLISCVTSKYLINRKCRCKIKKNKNTKTVDDFNKLSGVAQVKTCNINLEESSDTSQMLKKLSPRIIAEFSTEYDRTSVQI